MAMNRQVLNRAFAVGLLVAVCGVAFLIAFTFFRKGGYSEKDTYVVFAYFEDATGLTWKSRVQIAGIQVGEVERIMLAGQRARLDLRIRKDIDLRADACVTKRFPSALLPDALLDATGGKAPQSLRDLPEDQREVKCVVEATTVAKLLESMSKIADNVQDVTKELSGMVSGSEGSIRQIIKNLESITTRIDDTVANGSDNVAAILENAASFTGTLSQVADADRERYRAIARNIESASARLDQLLASVQGLVGEANDKEGKVKGAVQDARETLAHLNKSMEQVEKVTYNIGQGKGVAGKLLNDERLGEKLGTTIESVSDYVDRLYKLQLQVGLRSEWLLNQNGAKTYAGIKIMPRPDKYYLLEIVNDPRGINTVTTNTTVTQTGNGTFQTQTTSTLNEQRVAFSLEFAKRYGPATFRVGLIENSGGAGADLHLLNDRLTLSVNIYQFARPENVKLPRAKLWLDYRFLNYFYVTTGADDFLNSWRAQRFPGGSKFNIGNDVFFGGGLVFTDDDLKTLFSLIGGSAGTAASSASK
jgi:phospholipid/cholesterol/gamma-HCH transport system substrate-binding protein